MGLQVLIIQLSFVAILSALLLNKYGNWRIQHKIVTLSTFIGWYLSFIIIFVLPLDVGITFYEKCISEQMNSNQSTLTCDQPNGMVDNDVLYDLWRIVYWTSQLLTWIVLPIMQKYSTAADFTACRKLKSAILNNAIYYTSYLVIFVLCLLYALSKGLTLNWEHLRVLTTTASNSWGLFLLVVLLGYGLIEVPRKMWLISDPKYRLNKLYFSLSNIRAGKNEAEETTKEVYKEARDALELLKNDFDTRENIAEIVSKFKKDLIREIDAVKSNADYSHGGIQIDNLDIIRNITYLTKLNRRAMIAIQNHQRIISQYNAKIKKILFLEDVEEAIAHNSFNHWHHGSFSTKYIRIPPNILSLWYKRLKSTFMKLLAFFCTLMTLIVMWSECTFFISSSKISIAALLLSTVAEGSHYKYVQLMAVVLISYLCICAYYTLFKLKIYKYYRLDSHHQTDENSLLFSAILLCRLTPPICLNFLGMIHMDSHISQNSNLPKVETQFTKLMGHLDVLPLIARGIDIYMPLAIVILCVGTYLRLGSKFLHSIGIDQFVDEDEITLDFVENGKRLANLERSRTTHEKNKKVRVGFSKREVKDIEESESLISDIHGLKKNASEETLLIELDDIIAQTARTEHPSSLHLFDDL